MLDNAAATVPVPTAAAAPPPAAPQPPAANNVDKPMKDTKDRCIAIAGESKSLVPQTAANDAKCQDLIEFCQNAWVIFRKAIPLAASYTFSIEQVAAGVIALHINNDNTHAAATVLFQTVMATSVRVSLAPLFAVSIRAGAQFGELKKAQSAAVLDQKLIAIKQKQIALILKAGLVKSAIVTLPALLTLIFSEEMLLALGQSPEVSKLAATFLKPFAASAPALAVRMSLGQIMYANGDTDPSMYIGLGTFTVGTSLAVWLARGGWGLEAQQLAGIAWGFNVESYLTPLGYAIYIYRSKDYADFPFWNYAQTTWREIYDELGELVAVAGPVTFTMMVETALTFAMGVFAGRLGVQDQATLAFSMQTVFLIFLGLMAFGQTTGLTVGRLKGEEEYLKANLMAKHGLIITVLAVIPPCILVSTAPNILYQVLNVDGEENQQLVANISPLIIAGAGAMAARYNVNQVLRNLGDHKGSTMISAIGMLTGIAVAGALGLETEAALYGVASGLLIGEGLSLIGLMPRWCARIKPERIEQVKKDPTSAELKTWSEYIGSFFSSKPQANQLPAQPVANKTKNWGEYIGSFFCCGERPARKQGEENLLGHDQKEDFVLK